MKEIRFTEGFVFNNILYAWNGKDLYRMPQQDKKGFRGLTKLELKRDGTGYLVGSAFKSLSQLNSMTKPIQKITTYERD